MTKNYYEILGVGQQSTPEQIKKAYRKLATKWHPDKWNTKSLKEREEANQKMQEINKAYEILSDEDKRKRYDLGETDFTSASENDWDSHFETEKEKLRTEAEKIRFQMEAVAYREVLNTIGIEISISEIYPNSLDKNLWTPYTYWQEKVINLKVFIDSNGIDRVNSPLYKFQEEMINAIRKRKAELGNNNSYIDEERLFAIKEIEEELAKKGLKMDDMLEKHRDYQGQINSLTEIWEIRMLRDEIKRDIQIIEVSPHRKLVENFKKNIKDWDIKKIVIKKKKNFFGQSAEELMLIHNSVKEEYDSGGNLIIKEGKIYRMDEFSWEERNVIKEVWNEYHRKTERYESWTREELLDLVLRLEKENKELKAKIPQTPAIQEEINKRETQLHEIQSILNSNDKNKPSPFPILPTVGVVGTISLLALILYKFSKRRVRN